MNLSLVLAATLLLGQTPVEVKPLSGEAIRGDLVSLDADEIVVGAEAGDVRLPTKSVLRVTFSSTSEPPPVETPPSVWVELRDGTTLVGDSYIVAGGQAKVALRGGLTASPPTRAIRSVRLASHEGEAELAKQWADILAQKASEDLLVLRKKAEVKPANAAAAVKSLTSLDYLNGVLVDVTEETVGFEFDGKKRNVRRDRVEGLVYFASATTELPAVACRIHDRLGNAWSARSTTLQGDKLKLETPVGVAAELPLATIATLDYSAGKVVYLSDLTPEAWQWTPFFDASRTPSAEAFYRPRFDHALGGRPLQIGETTYSKGVHLRSRTRITWRLPGAFRKLAGVAGIDHSADDNGGKSGDVQLVILGDDKPLFDRRVRGEDGAVDLDIDLAGVKRLTVFVDYGGNIDIADFLDLAEARVTK